ncbi:MbtH family protein [Streptomyces sp. NPDC050161]|uniref:MbtH family protein n=1 Tax=unclassified Streptomyces TaxID=2593676 RepID=UPI003722D484
MNPADDLTYAVVVNDTRQYSIWDVSRALPAGWREEGFRGSERECLAHVDAVWTEMKPLAEQ